jgi:signal transduction histidine kinase
LPDAEDGGHAIIRLPEGTNLALDIASEISHALAPALRVVGSKHRLEILYVLSGGASTVSRIAEETGLSPRTVNRHLAVLRQYGLVKLQPSSGNGRVYSLDRDQAVMLNASFISVMARAGSVDVAAEEESAATAGEPVSPVALQTPEACTRCQNASFVRDVLDELDQSLVKAREYQVRLRQMSSQVLTAQEEERKRIARELHDDTAQALTSVLVRLRLLERSLKDERLRGGLAELRDLTGVTLEGVRRMAIDLRPPMLDDLGLEAALQSLVQDFSQRWPVRATFTSSRLGRLPAVVELVLYRIVQEALSNVAKHANASRVLVRLTRRGRTLRLLVEDDGCGFDVEATKHSRESGLGLFGIEERLALVGGTLRVDSVVGDGTRISAEAPLPRSGRR